MQALRQAGRPVPLIVLSSCSGGSASQAMAAGLVGRGADRVIAMLAPVTDGYATVLARRLYQELAARPGSTAGQALARARYLAEEDRSHHDKDRLPLPEYGVATLLAAGGDGPLVDPAAAAVPLTVATAPAGGRSVRELPVGVLIGRRAQLRTAMGVLRRSPAAVREFGAASGVVLTGIGGIGKTALAGRVISRLREDGWLIAVHEGRWNPTALITATAAAITDAAPRITDPALAAALARAGELLTDPGTDDGPKLAAVAGLLAGCRLLVVFDDFEQNLTPGGQEFLDPATGEAHDRAGRCRPDRGAAGHLPVPAARPGPVPGRGAGPGAVGGGAAADVPAAARPGRTGPRRPAAADPDHRRAPAADRVHRRAAARRPLQPAPRPGQAPRPGPQPGHRPAPGPAGDPGGGPGDDPGQRRHPAHRTARPAHPPPGRRPGPGRGVPRPDDPRRPRLHLHPWPRRHRGPPLRTARRTWRSCGRTPSGWPTSPCSHRARTSRCTRGPRRWSPATPQATSPPCTSGPWPCGCAGSSSNAAATTTCSTFPATWPPCTATTTSPSIAAQAAQILPGTLATVAYLAEIRPLIPPAERAWILVADLEVQALLSAGNLPAATRQLEAIHQQVETRAAADPANTEWQRDLSVSHNRLGDVAAAAGDLTAARDHYQASLDIRVRLAAADPANTEWQRDLSISHDKLGDVAAAAGDLTAARDHYQAALDIRVTAGRRRPRQHRMAARPVRQPQQARGRGGRGRGPGRRPRPLPGQPGHRRTAGRRRPRQHRMAARPVRQPRKARGRGGRRPGTWPPPATTTRPPWTSGSRLAAADPANTGWQRDLSVSHEQARGRGGRRPGT